MDSPENASVPDGLDGRLNTFNRLLLLRSWFPERAIPQMYNYIEETLGEQYGKPVVINVGNIWLESENTTPIIGLISAGCDPALEIELLAKKNKFSK